MCQPVQGAGGAAVSGTVMEVPAVPERSWGTVRGNMQSPRQRSGGREASMKGSWVTGKIRCSESGVRAAPRTRQEEHREG